MHFASYVLPHSKQQQTVETVAVLQVSGEIDVAERQRFTDAVEQAAEGQSTLVIDLDRVRYIDSIGLTVLIRAHKMMLDRGGCLTVAASTPLIRRLLVLTGLDRLFGMHEDVACAVRALTAPSV